MNIPRMTTKIRRRSITRMMPDAARNARVRTADDDIVDDGRSDALAAQRRKGGIDDERSMEERGYHGGTSNYSPKGLFVNCNPKCNREQVRFPPSIISLLRNLEGATDGRITFESEDGAYTGLSLAGADGKATLDGVRDALVQKLNKVVELEKTDVEVQEGAGRAVNIAIEKMESEKISFGEFVGSEMGKAFISSLTQRLNLQTRGPIPRQSATDDSDGHISENDLDQSFRTILSQFKTDFGASSKAIEGIDLFKQETRDQAVAYMTDKYRFAFKTDRHRFPTRAIQNYITQLRFSTVSSLGPSSDPKDYDIAKGFASNDLVDRANTMTDNTLLEFFTPSVPDEVVALDGIIKAVAAVRYHSSTIPDETTRQKAVAFTARQFPYYEASENDQPVKVTEIFLKDVNGDDTTTMAQVAKKLDTYVDDHLTNLEVGGADDLSKVRSEDNAHTLRIVANNVRQAIKYMHSKLVSLADQNGNVQMTDSEKDTFDLLLELDDKLEKIATNNMNGNAKLMKDIEGKFPNVFSDDQRGVYGQLNTAEGTEYKGGPLNRMLPRPKIMEKL
ncbi:hypothetical protein BC829DRAFT_448584 [Chytridium lagenaria]|nr:hypothetical protein BC829DRAFT_448584 [Chytridium lagenaria]